MLVNNAGFVNSTYEKTQDNYESIFQVTTQPLFAHNLLESVQLSERYGDSKLCLTVHAKTLQKKFRQEGINIHTYACHPGAIPTNLWHNLGIAGLFLPIANLIFRSTDDAASVVLYPSLTPGVGDKLGGEYFESGKAVPPNKQVDLPEVQKRLWERSWNVTQDAN
ncbi:Short-chain dehydrogenase TIC 32, chloroplastic [Orchesella cincta]|uniref:Short-chain dehydrogenase TIC 32, chloroplastic n=1 Tax=Orchesella cincta TaxID=48709 RepID=A0A1D2MQ84_ORCCI|nr:Short-chain dehydrogenase TIC 32, chloroplastic [Orchesella cincta]